MKGKIIDLRLRPPIDEYRAMFPLAMASKNPPIPAWESGSSDLNLVYKEMDQAGIKAGLIHGRHVYHLQSGEDGVPLRVEDDRIEQVVRESDGRFFGFAGTDLAKPMDEILSGIDRGINQLGLKGVNVEPGHAPTPIYADHESLTPIYEKCIELDVPVMFMTGFFCGSLTQNDPQYFERVAFRFPKLKLLLAHGCYPYVTHAIALAVKCRNVYVSPDIYMFMPGGSMFVEALSLRPSQFLFGTAYPFGELTSCTEKSLQFPVTEKVLEKYMYRNAERLLKL